MARRFKNTKQDQFARHLTHEVRVQRGRGMVVSLRYSVNLFFCCCYYSLLFLKSERFYRKAVEPSASKESPWTPFGYGMAAGKRRGSRRPITDAVGAANEK